MNFTHNLPIITLLCLILLTVLTSGKRHRHSKRRHHHHKHKSSYRRIKIEDYDDTYYYDNYDSFYETLYPPYPKHYKSDKQKHHVHAKDPDVQGRGILSNLFTASGKVVNDLIHLDPFQALKDATSGIFGAKTDLIDKFGEFASGIQTLVTNLAADEINDLLGAADCPINYQLFTPENAMQPMIMNKTSNYMATTWNKNLPVKVIIHGFSPQLEAQSTVEDHLYGQLTIKNSYFASGARYNVIVADWTSLARTFNYLSAAASTRVAGVDVAQFLHNLYKQGGIRSFDDVHIIGFSLGAHVSGVAGRQIQELEDEAKVGRITGLDPAELTFGTLDGKVPHDARFVLDKSDAKFVDIVHCNAGILLPIQLGLRALSGHVDFFPNGGKSQPGCSGLTVAPCSHSRCWKFFAESIGNYKYNACKCDSWENFQSGKCGCQNQEKVFMGDVCTKKARGTYYLRADISKVYDSTNFLPPPVSLPVPG